MKRKHCLGNAVVIWWGFSAKGRSGSKNDEKVKVLRMEFSIVESLSGLQMSIFNLSRGPQVHFGEKSKNWSNFMKFIDFPPFPLFGVPWAAVISRRTRGLATLQTLLSGV